VREFDSSLRNIFRDPDGAKAHLNPAGCQRQDLNPRPRREIAGAFFMVTKMKIMQEIQRHLIPLKSEEKAQLEENIISEGCRDALVLWGDVLVDGHNRFEICERNGIGYRTAQKDFDSLEDAIAWVEDNQLGRRNLTPDEFRRLIGRKYNRVKASIPNPDGAGGKSGKVVRDQNDPQQKTADKLSAEHGVSGPTVKRAGAAMDSIDTRGTDGLRDKVDSGDVPIYTAAKIAEMEEEEQEEILRDIDSGVKPSEAVKAHVGHNSGNNEWYTPPEFIESARAVMGSIDLDPASSEIANKTVKAERLFSAEDDGISQAWSGNVWINPPYAQPLIRQFCEKLADSLDSVTAVMLVNNATETGWFQLVASRASAICFISKRVKFLDPDGNPGAPLQGQAALYFGAEIDDFAKEFEQYGFVVRHV